MSSSITHIKSVAELDPILDTAKSQLVVIDFHAEWCGPCHMIAPVYESLSTKNPQVKFLKCDVDAAPDVAKKYNISAMPTFIFIKAGEQVEMVRGANKAALEAAIEKHATA